MARNLTRIVATTLALAAATLAHPAQATVFGVKTCGSGSVACTGNAILSVLGGGSLAPSRLFSFNETTASFTDIAPVTLAGDTVDIDALAMSSAQVLVGYALTHSVTNDIFGNLIAATTGSRLVRIDTATGAWDGCAAGTRAGGFGLAAGAARLKFHSAARCGWT